MSFAYWNWNEDDSASEFLFKSSPQKASQKLRWDSRRMTESAECLTDFFVSWVLQASAIHFLKKKELDINFCFWLEVS